VENVTVAEHIPALSCEKDAVVVLAVVGVEKGADVKATVEGVVRVSGNPPEIAAKVGTFYELATAAAKVVEETPDELEARRGAALAGRAAGGEVAASLGASATPKRGRFEELSTPPGKVARKSGQRDEGRGGCKGRG